MKLFVKYFACALITLFASSLGAFAQTATPVPTPKDTQSLVNNIPIPPHNEWKGVHFPYREGKKLKMKFTVDVMERTDEDHIKMTNAKIITFDDDEKPDLTLLLPSSVLDLTTRILTSNQKFIMQRSDLEVLGDSLQLDTLARKAKITGNIKMIIYNFQQQPTGKETPHE